MAVARKVFTEAMVRYVMKAHFEVESDLPISENYGPCNCGWNGTNFEDHFIDQLHKRWHETVGRIKDSKTFIPGNTVTSLGVKA